MDVIELWTIYKPKWTPQTVQLLITINLLIILALFCLQRRFHWKGYRLAAGYALGVYLLFVFASTVFTRSAYTGGHLRLELFWSYKWGIQTFGRRMIRENFLNLLMLMPIGLFFPLCLPKTVQKKRAVTIFLTVFLGMICSASIEILQWKLQRGLCEFDDLFHNTLGVAIVAVICASFLKRGQNKRKK